MGEFGENIVCLNTMQTLWVSCSEVDRLASKGHTKNYKNSNFCSVHVSIISRPLEEGKDAID